MEPSLITNRDHFHAVLNRWRTVWKTNPDHSYIVLDSETEGKPGYGKAAALVIGRSRTKCWAMCFRGEAYTLPYSNLGTNFPTQPFWDGEFALLLKDPAVCKVFHNYNYDANVFRFNHGIVAPIRPFWCTMVATWAAAPWLEKTLKSLMMMLGRQQRATKTVDFSDPFALADYAQGDVIGTEELFLIQRFGQAKRSKNIPVVQSDLSIKYAPNPYFGHAETIRVPELNLSPFMDAWCRMQEFPYLDVVVNEAEYEGTPFDVARAREIREVGKQQYAEKLNACYSLVQRGHTIANLFSNRQIGDYLTNIGITGLPKTPSGQIKVDDKTLAKLAPQYPFVAALREVKAAKKMMDSFVGWEDCNPERPEETPKSGIEFYVDAYGTIRPTQNTVGAVTGRTSCSNPNEQQMPARKDTLGIRRCFSAIPISSRDAENLTKLQIAIRRSRAKRALIVLDHSQLELRGMCLLCEDPKMTEILSSRDGDMHATTAGRLQVDRTPAKNLNFLLQYGGNEHALAAQLTYLGFPATEDEVRQWRADYDTLYYRVHEYRDELVAYHIKHGFIRLFCGRPRHLPDIDPGNSWSMHKAETTLSNNAVQGSGQDFMKAAVVRCSYKVFNPDAAVLRSNVGDRKHRLVLTDYSQRLETYRKLFKKTRTRMLNQVHDELKYLTDVSAAEEVTNAVATVMSWRHYIPSLKPYRVPLVVEGGYGYDWATAKKGNFKVGFEEWERYAD